ncbi:MAG: hypothetical protein ACT4OD_07040 [Candidatus Nitrosotenuis sp.]
MKILFAFLLAIVVLPAFADPLSDRTGLKTSFSVEVGKDVFVVESTANFDVRNVSFEDNKLVFAINSSLENNIGEIQIPNGITQGTIKFSLDGAEITPKIMQNDRISFVTLEFAGNGTHTLEMTSDYTPKQDDQETVHSQPISDENPDDIVIILAVIGIVVAGGAGTTLAVYFKRKKI